METSKGKYGMASTRIAKVRHGKKKSYSDPFDLRPSLQAEGKENEVTLQSDLKIRLSDNSTSHVIKASAPLKLEGGSMSVVIPNPRNTITKNISLSSGEISLVCTPQGHGM